MCCSFEPAHFSDTVVMAHELSELGLHVVGYQNHVRNGNGFSGLRRETQGAQFQPLAISGRTTGNAMLLHFPAAEPMTRENMLDTNEFPWILDDMVEALRPPTQPLVSLGGPLRSIASAMPKVQVFEKGAYHVVLARDAHYIPQALPLVPEEKRPPLKDGIFLAYSEWFPGWPCALCCFNNAETVKADPLLWWYKPMFPQVLHMPALDAHDGNPPDLNGQVLVDHWVVASSDRLTGGVHVNYRNTIPEDTRKYVPSQILGRQYNRLRMQNGDFACDIRLMLRGNTEECFMRLAPGDYAKMETRAVR